MYYYKALIQYDGTGYAGFQWQKNIPTIQNDFNVAIMSLGNGKITTMGASRTDTGVHALEQVVKVTSENPLDCKALLSSINQKLSTQIKCLDILPCTGDFKPSSDHLCKEYRYYFTNKKVVSLEDRRFISNFSNTLDIDLIRFCAEKIIGIHNFQNFYSEGSNIKSTFREIILCELGKIKLQIDFPKSKLFNIPSDLIDCYQLKIAGNGFLKQMIRHLISALWMVGCGKLSKEDFLNLLHGPKNKKRLWKVAPANGLFLYKIKYPISHTCDNLQPME